MVLVKNLKFSNVFILIKIRQENVIEDILETEKAFIDYENKKLKRKKKWDFSWFWSKI